MLYLVVHVIPSSKKQSIAQDAAQRIKIHLKSVPERGAANHELIHYLAQLLDMPPRSLHIVSGATSRKKRIQIDTHLSMHDIMKKLQLEEQHAFI